MSDLIDRQAAIDAFAPYGEYESNLTNAEWVRRINMVLSALPSAQTDLSEYCDRLWKMAYERGKKETLKRKTGRWIYMLRDSENDEYRCSVCSNPSGYDYDYCPHCGADMRKETGDAVH